MLFSPFWCVCVCDRTFTGPNTDGQSFRGKGWKGCRDHKEPHQKDQGPAAGVGAEIWHWNGTKKRKIVKLIFFLPYSFNWCLGSSGQFNNYSNLMICGKKIKYNDKTFIVFLLQFLPLSCLITSTMQHTTVHTFPIWTVLPKLFWAIAYILHSKNTTAHCMKPGSNMDRNTTLIYLFLQALLTPLGVFNYSAWWITVGQPVTRL